MKNTALFAFALLILLTACGQRMAVQGDEPSNAHGAMTWQEQYDLGMRYLTEGNYQEAIIAFTAAIEIDPKRPEAYASLAEVYINMEDIDAAIAILEEGIAQTDSEDLRAQLDAIRAVPESQFRIKSGYEEWDAFSAPLQQHIQDLITILENGDKELAWEMLQDPVLGEIKRDVYSEYANYRVNLFSDGDHSGTGIEVHPKDGEGYFCYYSTYGEGNSSHQYLVGQCGNWNWNGSYSLYRWEQASDYKMILNYTGTMKDSLLDGVVSISQIYESFDSGTISESSNEIEYINGERADLIGLIPDGGREGFRGTYAAIYRDWLWND